MPILPAPVVFCGKAATLGLKHCSDSIMEWWILVAVAASCKSFGRRVTGFRDPKLSVGLGSGGGLWSCGHPAVVGSSVAVLRVAGAA